MEEKDFGDQMPVVLDWNWNYKYCESDKLPLTALESFPNNNKMGLEFPTYIVNGTETIYGDLENNPIVSHTLRTDMTEDQA